MQQEEVETLKLLNPMLATALAIAFPSTWERIKVRSVGQRRIPSRSLGLDGPPDEYGEEYALDCPFCGDTRCRMRVNHTLDPMHYTHRWCCYNESCHRNAGFRLQLSQALMRVWTTAKAQVRAGIAPPVFLDPAPSDRVSEEPGAGAAMPDDFLQLDQLEPGHPARQYVESRGFDPDYLASNWLVGYSVCSSFPSPGFHDRLVIPFFNRANSPDSPVKPLGWQARSIFVVPNNSSNCAAGGNSPKYLSMAGMHKSRLLYSSPAGIAPSEQLIVVEGATDAWRCGEDAVAILGKQASPEQKRLIITASHATGWITTGR